MNSDRLWESLVDLVVKLRRGEVNLDELATKVVGERSWKKPCPKTNFLNSNGNSAATVKTQGKIKELSSTLDHDFVSRSSKRNRDIDEEVSAKRIKIIHLHHLLLVGDYDGADDDHTWRKSIKKFIVKTNPGKPIQDFTKSSIKIKSTNYGGVLIPPPIPIQQDSVARIQRRCIFGGGGRESLVLVIEKKLFQTDVDPDQGRLSIPHRQINRLFLSNLSPDEAARLDSTIEGIPMTLLLGPHHEEHAMSLRNWKSNKVYALVGGWKQVCRRIGLEAGETIELWCFRRENSELCLVIVNGSH